MTDRINELQKEIVIRVRAINQQKEEKKISLAAYKEIIKTLEIERDELISRIDEIRESEKQQKLKEEADEILLADAQPNNSVHSSLLD